MLVYRCKECGGNIELLDNGLGKCLYCGATQTLPKEKDDRINNFLNRANDFRLNCDFDRAIFEYEKVLELAENEPEAHWGIFLSRYGVEYIKDKSSFTYKPTIHRISSVSVFDDIDYQATVKYADCISANKYKEDAEIIEKIMKEFLLLSTQQEQYDIFLSYKELDDKTRLRTNDSYLAHDLYNELTSQGYKVFFAPKSLDAGLYEPKIYSAIISSKVMIVLGTQAKYFEAVWVKNEWSRFSELIEFGEQKILIPIFKDMEAGELPNRLAKYQALDMSNISFFNTLLGMIEQIVHQKSKLSFNNDFSAENAFIERGFLALEDGNFSGANSFFEKSLDLNPHNSEVYFGKLMAEMKIKKQEYILTSPVYLNQYKSFDKAVRFADQKFKRVLINYEQEVRNSINDQIFASQIVKIQDVKETDDLKQIYDALYKIKDHKNIEYLIMPIDILLSRLIKIDEECERIKQEILNYEQNKSTLMNYKNYFFRFTGAVVCFIILFFVEQSLFSSFMDSIFFYAVFLFLPCWFLDSILKDCKTGRKLAKINDVIEDNKKRIESLQVKYQTIISDARQIKIGELNK